MAFALSIVTLQEAMQKDGCPVCRLAHDAAIRSIDSFLWENTNDAKARKPINDAYGFCPQHTRMLVAIEMSNSGPVLGVNIIYELLAKNVRDDLVRFRSQAHTPIMRSGWFQKLKNYISPSKQHTILQPKDRCPVCLLTEQSAGNILSTLFEVLNQREERMMLAYRQSNGLCLQHLRIGLANFTAEHPIAADFLLEDTIQRLSAHNAEMKEYIRKQNWEYRAEKCTKEESVAWLRTLTFFTGYPPEKFSHLLEEF